MTHSKDDSDSLFYLSKTFMDKLADGTISKAEALLFLQIGRAVAAPPVPIADQIAEWRVFLNSSGYSCNLSEVVIPRYTPGLDRLLIVPDTVCLNGVTNLIRERIDVWVQPEIDGNLAASVPQNARTNNKPYAIWVRDQFESDDELKNMPANEMDAHGIPTMTLLERLLFGVFRFNQTYKHLDVIGGTLCSGSRTLTGRVPYVEWSPDDCTLSISTTAPDYRSTMTKARLIAD